MHPVSALLHRNLDRLPAGRITWINPPPDAPEAFTDRAEALAGLDVLTQDYRVARTLQARLERVTFGDFPAGPGDDTRGILLTMPKSKALLEMMLHAIAYSMPGDARLWLLGENRTGIKSAGPRLSACFAQVGKLDSARHCVLYEASEPRQLTRFGADLYCKRFTVAAPGGPLSLASWPGVFAHGRLDHGSAMLLPHLANVPRGARALDLGCGCGVLGTWLARAWPGAEVVLADSHALAVRASHATLAHNRLIGTVLPSDGFSKLEGRFDLVVSNPPFHREHATVSDMSLELLSPVRNFLAPGGQLLLVANRHLPYRSWLDQLFGSHAVLESDSRYHVLRASGPG